MDSVVLQSVTKVFHHPPAFFNWLGSEHASSTYALQDLSLNVAAGEVVALLGPNASGKTTALKLISTMLLPDSGRVTVKGSDTSKDPRRVRSQVGFAVASERSFFPRLTARENLDFFAALDNLPRRVRASRVETVLNLVGLPENSDTLVMKFSTGMYQRLAIARALLKQPGVLLLDEPTRSLDPGSAAHFWNVIREIAARGTSVLVASHNFNEAVALADTVAVLFRGRLAGLRALSARTTVDDLRTFYLDLTGDPEEVPELSLRSTS